MYRIFTINPGGGSTKVALFEDEKRVKYAEIRHSPEELAKFKNTLEQVDFRRKAIMDFIEKEGIDIKSLNAVVGRGGAFKPLKSGVYLVDEDVLRDVFEGRVQADHPSNLGVVLAKEIADRASCNAYFVDPVSVDEFDDIARLSGLKELERKSLSHALNTKYVARKVAQKVGKKYEEMNLIVAHLGTGISISPHRKGKMFDVNNANDGGPFSPQRAGTLPTTGLIKLCFSGKYDRDSLLRKVTRGAGLLDYLGTDDLREVIRRIENGDDEAKLVYEAMVYQIAKEIGAMAAALKGKVDYIIITGGMAQSEKLVKDIEDYVKWIAPVEVIPGENEMEALAYGVLLVLRGELEAKKYGG